jgi:hypothetical protein
MTSMTSARALTRVLPLALVVATSCAIAAQAQTLPWPSAAPQQQQPASAPWPTDQPAAPASMPAPSMPAPSMAGPGMGAPGMTMGGPGPTPEQQQCMQEFTGYRGEVEKRAKAAEAESRKKPTREKMCELVTLYSAAETKWLKFSETNVAKCGIPPQAIEQIKAVHVHTMEAKKKLCAPGPAQAAAPSTPSLSDALGASLQPNNDEQKKRKTGGVMDTLTGNVLTR